MNRSSSTHKAFACIAYMLLRTTSLFSPTNFSKTPVQALFTFAHTGHKLVSWLYRMHDTAKTAHRQQRTFKLQAAGGYQRGI